MKRNALLFCLGVSIAMPIGGCRHTPSSDGTLGDRPVTVNIQPVISIVDSSQTHYSGVAEAVRSIALSFPVNGLVEQVLATEGQPVHKGELLARIDAAVQENNVKIAEAKAAQADDMLRRITPLHENGSLSDSKLVDVRTSCDEAALAVAQTRKLLADTRLTAPQNGIIARRSIECGETVLPGAPAFTLADIGRMYIRIPVPEKEISRIKEGQHATVTLPALGGQTFPGKVARIGIDADPFSRTYDVRVEVDNREKVILPGMLATVNLSLGGCSRTVLPIGAVAQDPDGNTCVFAVDRSGARVQRRTVTLSGFGAGRYEVVNGVGVGEWVVTGGVQKMFDHAPIAPIKAGN